MLARISRERRSYPRIAVEMTVSCERAGEPALVAAARDIGLGGIFIESSAPPPPFGSAVVVVGRLPGTTAELRLPGIVRWVKKDGFGVQFDSLGARETHAISLLLR